VLQRSLVVRWWLDSSNPPKLCASNFNTYPQLVGWVGYFPSLSYVRRACARVNSEITHLTHLTHQTLVTNDRAALDMSGQTTGARRTRVKLLYSRPATLACGGRDRHSIADDGQGMFFRDARRPAEYELSL
jgi:hypothetical protein